MATEKDNNEQQPVNNTSTPDNNGGNSTTTGSTSTTPAQPSTATPPINGQQPYSGFQGSNYAELEDFIKGQMADVKVETPEERKKRERREKIEGAINGIADMGMALGNLYFTSQYAPNAYNGQNSLSEKYQQRLDKAKADREKNRDAYINYALTLGKLKDADRDFNFRVEQARNLQNNWQKTYDAGRQDREEDVQWRKDRAGVADTQWQKGYDEGVREFDKNLGLQRSAQAEAARHNKASEGLQRKSLSIQQNANYTQFYAGGDMISIPNSSLNRQTIGYIFSKTPSDNRPKGKPVGIYGEHEDLTTDEMLKWIGENANDENVQNAIRKVGGKVQKNRGRGY